MLRAGFPGHEHDWTIHGVSLLSEDRAMLASFLYAIKEFAPEIAEIEQEVCQSLGVDLTVRAPVSTWQRQADFSIMVESNTNMIRNVSYQTASSESIISHFGLFGYSDGDFLFSVGIEPDAGVHLRQILRESGLPLRQSDDGAEIRLCFNRASVENFNRLLTILSQNSSHFSQICDDFKRSVNPIITTPVIARPLPVESVTESGFFQAGQATSIQSPSAGKNDAKLAEIGFDNENIPDQYCCPLSLAIMTEPVYARGLEQYQFEKSWITRHLTTSNAHPFTRQPLSASDLIPNEALKMEITTFVESAVREHRENTPRNTSA
jgi:hypothetical protein